MCNHIVGQFSVQQAKYLEVGVFLLCYADRAIEQVAKEDRSGKHLERY